MVQRAPLLLRDKGLIPSIIKFSIKKKYRSKIKNNPNLRKDIKSRNYARSLLVLKFKCNKIIYIYIFYI